MQIKYLHMTSVAFFPVAFFFVYAMRMKIDCPKPVNGQLP